MKNITIELEELVCPMCATKIEKALLKLAGVSSCSVLYNASKAKVSFDEAVLDVDKIVSTIVNVGYDVIKVK